MAVHHAATTSGRAAGQKRQQMPCGSLAPFFTMSGHEPSTFSTAQLKAGKKNVRVCSSAGASAAAAKAGEGAAEESCFLSRKEAGQSRGFRFDLDVFEPPRLLLPTAAVAASSSVEQKHQRWVCSADSKTASATQGQSSSTVSSASAVVGLFSAAAQREIELAALAAAATASLWPISQQKETLQKRGSIDSDDSGSSSRINSAASARGTAAEAAVEDLPLRKHQGLREKKGKADTYREQLQLMQAAAAAEDAELRRQVEAQEQLARLEREQAENERRQREAERLLQREKARREAEAAAAAAAAAAEQQQRREREEAERREREEAQERIRQQQQREEAEAQRKKQEELLQQRCLEQQRLEQQQQQLQQAELLKKKEEEALQQEEELRRQQRLLEEQQQSESQKTPAEGGEAAATAGTTATIAVSDWLPMVDEANSGTLYMKDVEVLLQEGRLYREINLQQLPGFAESDVKALRVAIKKQINTALNQLASTTSQVIRTCEFLRGVLKELKQKPPLVLQYFIVQLCVRLLQLTEKGGQVSTRPSAAWAYAFLLRGMTQEDTSVERVFRAHLFSVCCFAAPFYYRKKQGMSVEQFKLARGQREGEEEEAFFTRMAACIRLWLSYLIASHKEEEAWAWLARFLNLNLSSKKAPRRVCACILVEGLRIAGPALLCAYGKQFRKIMDLTQASLMPLLLTMQQKNEGSCVSMYITQLRTLMNDYYAKNCTLPEPEGKAMKVEATEANPDI